ncbi:hypothetical protein [Erwinia typographi]|uniref:hypothetical protein n=1 Tax=Erwinia typographi TaxID=371042 RepID=UPI0012EDB424|nr:hypothetical protein [Erwinia typographi]
MKKSIIPFFLAAIVAGTTSFVASATTVQNYKCTDSKWNKGPMKVVSVGLGVTDGAADWDSIVFCTSGSVGCYASSNYINSDAGKADYAGLLTALTLGLNVSFYCESGGYAKNIHILR